VIPLLSTNLKTLRQRANYTLEALSEIIGVSRQAVAKWESGESSPDIDNCAKLAKLYNVSLDALVNESLDKMLKAPSENGKYMFGVVTVDENCRISLPPRACEVFEIISGDMLLIVGDKDKGIAIVKCDGANSFIK
jgi:transcriptional regulator with XRE-family HTH domain